MNFTGPGGNPPWARQSGAVNYGSSTGSFNTNSAYGQATGIGQPGLALPTSLSSVPSSFSAQRPVAVAAQTASSNSKQRVFTGVVTKVSDNFGFVDEDVFFQTSVCKNGVPKLGDRVLVEATFNANMPFKWNATRIQLILNQQTGAAPQQQSQQIFQQQVTAVQQLNALQHAQAASAGLNPILNQGINLQHQIQQLATQQQTNRFNPMPSNIQPLMSRDLTTSSSSSSNRASRFDQRDRRDERRDRRPSPPPRKRSRSPRRRTRSPKPKSRSRSPKRKQKATPRYSVNISPLSLDTKECSVIDVRNRYSNLYIPSDFYKLSLNWVSAFSHHHPFPLGNHTKFHIFGKEVDPLQPHPESVDPADADYSYSAKVMLLTQPSLEEIYHDCCSLAEDLKDEDFTHPARVLQFLVGVKSKNEPLAIGGPWSPSLDGKDPENDPQVLINTAIRTTKSLTGIDLSSCTQWYRFVEIKYLRDEEVRKGKTIPAHTENVVMFLPDIWSVVPTLMEYSTLKDSYRLSMLRKLGQGSSGNGSTDVGTNAAAEEDVSQSQDNEDEVVNTSADGTRNEKQEPSHWSKLDPKNMKVVDLRSELEARNLPCKGLKGQLQAKLSKALKSEMEQEENKDENVVSEEPTEEKEESSESQPRELTEEEKEASRELEKKKAQLERFYNLPEDCVIPVHPNRSAKNGKFDCSVMSLSVLLDYRPEDNKEHSFEVSLFAESFNEMLMRDFGFVIYKKLSAVPNKPEETKKKDDKAEKKDSADVEASAKNNEGKPATNKATDEEKNKPNEEKETKEKPATNKDDKTTEPEAKRRKKDDEDDDRESTVSSKERERTSSKRRTEDRRHWVTADRAALLAFVYYDTTHTGFIVDKDLEDLMYTLGLQLSRSQVRKLVQRVCGGKETLHYRKLTDKPGDRPDESQQLTENEIDLKVLAQGNKTVQSGSKSEETSMKTDENIEESRVVMYQGAVLELDKVMSKLDKSESSRLEAEKQTKALKNDLASVNKKLERSEEKIKRLSSDLKKTSDKLSSVKSDKRKSEDDVRSYKDILHSSSKDLHKLLRLVDGALKPADEHETKTSGSDRYTPTKDPGINHSSNGTTPNKNSSVHKSDAKPVTSNDDKQLEVKEEVNDKSNATAELNVKDDSSIKSEKQ